MATASLLTFLNAGDAYAHPHVLSRAAASHAREGWSWGFGLARAVDERGAGVRPVRPIAYQRRLHALGMISVPHQAVFMTNELFRNLGGFDPQFGLAADTHLLLRAAGVARPRVWNTVDVEYLVGGQSDLSVFRLIYAKHRIRLALGSLALRPAPLDLIWTAGHVAMVAMRKAGKRLLTALFGGRFIRWWSARGL